MSSQNSIVTYSPDTLWGTITDKLAEMQFGSNKIPKEISKIIFFYLSETNLNYRSLLNFFSTNKSLSEFRKAIPYLNPSLFHDYSIIKLLHTNLTNTNRMKIIGALHRNSLLSIDHMGRHFYRAYIDPEGKWLYISDPNKGFVSMDLLGETASIRIGNVIKGNNSIDGLIPTKNGFVVFSKEGFGVWEFQDNTSKPKIKNFVSLELNYNEEVTFLGNYEGKCFFRVGNLKNYLVKYYDIQKKKILDLKFPKDELDEPYYLGQYKSQLCWNRTIVKINEELAIEKIGPLSKDETSRGEKWNYKGLEISKSLFVEYVDEFGKRVNRDILCIDGSNEWMHPRRLQYPNWDNLKEHFFFIDDFLVLSYINTFRIIHLPSKTEYSTKKFISLISAQLGKKWNLFYLRFISSEEVELFITAIESDEDTLLVIPMTIETLSVETSQ